MSNPIQNYAWGSHSVLAALQGRQAPTRQPEAELWMGAHASAPSVVDLGDGPRSLADLTPDLPFLLKILAIEAPLSLQVHPSTEQAREGYARENGHGVPVDAPNRNYKDDRAKPETVVALTDMWLLAGEQERGRLRELAHLLGVQWLPRVVDSDSAVRAALALPKEQADEAVRECVAAASRAREAGLVPRTAAEGGPDRLAPDATLLERTVHLIDLIHHHHPGDPGMLVALCMNLVHLSPGQAMHTPAQQLHAYVSGTAVEIMGCSDNVLRAGLTRKHMDVPELLSVMAQQQAPVKTFAPVGGVDGWADYPLWDPQLHLSRVALKDGRPISRAIPDASMILVTEGRATVGPQRSGAPVQEVSAGHSLLHLGETETVEFAGDAELFLVMAA